MTSCFFYRHTVNSVLIGQMPAMHTTIFNLTAECHPKEAIKEETFKKG